MSLSRHLDFVLGVPLLKLLSPFIGKPSNITTPRKILIIKLAAMGDTILLVPVLKRFREAHPEATIHWLVSPINEVLARSISSVDKLIVWNRKMGALLPLIAHLRSQHYDAIVDLEQWSRGTALISSLAGAPVRLGFDAPGQHRTALFTGTYPKRYDAHEIQDFSGLLSLLGPMSPIGPLELPAGFADEAELEQFRNIIAVKDRKHKAVVLHPGCGADGLPREWPLAEYAVLAHWMIKNFGAKIILTSGPEERKKTFDLKTLLKGNAVDLGGRLSWCGMAALLTHVDLVVSGNTGIMHLAAALQKKQVALHGPTNAALWGPINPHARVVRTACPLCPCLRLGFEYHAVDSSCMNQIDIEKVKEAVSSLIC